MRKSFSFHTILLLSLLFLSAAVVLLCARPVHAQATTSDSAALSATIESEILADPRSQSMSQEQINAMVSALTQQAEAQGITPSQITYKPALAEMQNAQAAPTSCSDISCIFQNAFGLDGSVPIIPIALFVLAALFILIYGIMREMGHPHTQPYQPPQQSSNP